MAPRKPRVLVLAPDFPPQLGGIQNVVINLVRNWDRIEPRVVTLVAAAGRDYDKGLPFPVHRVGIMGWDRRLNIVLANLDAVLVAIRHRPDIVLCAHIVMSPAARFLKQFLKLPYAAYIYGKEAADRRGLTGFATRGADAVLAISNYSKSLVEQPGAKTQIVLPGVELPATNGWHRDEEGHVILTVARLVDRYKGHDVMIRAMPLIRSRFPDAEYVVLGDGPLRGTHQALATSIGSEAVRFVGAVSDEDKMNWYRSAAVFAMPSRLDPNGAGEGFGIVYVEAGTFGLPVIAGNLGGATDAVIDGSTGVLVDPTDHVALADAVCDLFGDVEERRRLGAAGHSRAQQLAWPKVAHKVEDLLLSLVSTVSRPPLKAS